MKFRKGIALLLALSMVLPTTACGSKAEGVSENTKAVEENAESAKEKDSQSQEESKESPELETKEVEKLSSLLSGDSGRVSLISKYITLSSDKEEAKVEAFELEKGLANVYNLNQFSLTDEQKSKLEKDYFYLDEYGSKEFFETYESNRYLEVPNFVTVDSMMHTYHLYFAYLLKNIERKYLFDSLSKLTDAMLEESRAQYELLKGSEWEEASKVNLCFFNVASCLLKGNDELDDVIKETGAKELQLIEAAEGIEESPLLKLEEDYSQYIPRGYYDTDENLKKYFKAMMWYGRRNFTRETPDGDDIYDRSALLMTMALNKTLKEDWEKIYLVSTFFSGASDDSGYYEYMPLIEEVYGENPDAEKLLENEKAFADFHELTGKLKRPEINSIVFHDNDSEEVKDSKSLGYRFMGQRFSIDESIFANLVYDAVLENEKGDKRLLPDALDIPAAFGSQKALSILEDQGEFEYKGYSENMEKVRNKVKECDESFWANSLYSEWIHTLAPLVEKKGEGYPLFMQSEEWEKKKLLTFLGSYAELKHDTVLYSKQLMAEMGGGDIEEYDDRGYVEPEVEVYARLNALVNATRQGLSEFEMLTEENEKDLDLLAELSRKLTEISKKELRDELLTDEEYDLIRSYGGQIEHFWQAVYKEESDSEYLSSEEFPAAVVVDVATDPNGSVLEIGTGNPRDIRVIVKVDDKIKIAVGSVYSFYQFPWPINDRLTDKKWREMLGIEFEDYTQWHESEVDMPDWTNSLVVKSRY
ncbi:MAG: DUF3160 domain-containing protein [Lachnospiraceae bacterium]|nr:DUF3160 domain-containing protein [Lachnospiraceae bacterium]